MSVSNPWSEMVEVEEDDVIENVLTGNHYRVKMVGHFDVHVAGIETDDMKSIDKRKFDDGPWQKE